MNHYRPQGKVIFFTGRNEVVAKVMLLLVSVILSTGGVCLSACWDTTSCQGDPPAKETLCQGDPPAKETPTHPLQRRPPCQGDPPAKETPLPGRPPPPAYSQWVAGTHPTGMHSNYRCLSVHRGVHGWGPPPATHAPQATHAPFSIHAPSHAHSLPYGWQVGGTYSTGMHSCYPHKCSLRRLCFYKCLSVHRRGVYPSMHWDRPPPWEQTPPPSRHPPGAVHAGRYGQQTGGTHPTGMHSCLQFNYMSLLQNFKWSPLEINTEIRSVSEFSKILHAEFLIPKSKAQRL